MLYITGNAIKLTRGDTAFLTVPLVCNNEEYTMGPDDVLVLSMKEYITDPRAVLRKEVKGGNVFHIEPNDTSGLPFGKYKYDIQLNMANGDVFTVIDVDTFEILQEVTC